VSTSESAVLAVRVINTLFFYNHMFRLSRRWPRLFLSSLNRPRLSTLSIQRLLKRTVVFLVVCYETTKWDLSFGQAILQIRSPKEIFISDHCCQADVERESDWSVTSTGCTYGLLLKDRKRGYS